MDDAGVWTWRTRVHIYDLDSLGHVNNANYFPYLQQATEEAFPAAGVWQLQHLSMEYITPALHGAGLAIHVWIEDTDKDGASLGYAVEREEDQQVLLRARLVWETADGGTPALPGAPAGLPTTLPRDYQIRPARPVDELPGSRQFRWRHRVRGYEAGRNGEVSAAHVLRWTEEARAGAALEVGWSYQRMGEADFVAVVIRHEFDFRRMPRPGDDVEIVSQICEMRRVRGAWRHDVFCNGELVAAARVSGGFLNSAGQPHPPPAALIDRLLGRIT
ncbi:MAG: thioesterase [Caldilineales bacterium]